MSVIKENDVCLMYVDGLPTNFIRIESIIPDVKPGWWEVQFIELVLPLQTIKWKIDDGHLKGETIHMKGTAFNFQVIECQVEKKGTNPLDLLKTDEPKQSAKIISMIDFKEKRKIKAPAQELPPDVA